MLLLIRREHIPYQHPGTPVLYVLCTVALQVYNETVLHVYNSTVCTLGVRHLYFMYSMYTKTVLHVYQVMYNCTVCTLSVSNYTLCTQGTIQQCMYCMYSKYNTTVLYVL